jgi:ketosteroid isomerase-like protein
MTTANAREIVEALRVALETRRYDEFVGLFADDGAYELPFALPGVPGLFTGIASIRARFDVIAQSPMTKLLDVRQVSATLMETADPEVVVVEFSARGMVLATGEAFDVATSIAVIRFGNGKVKQYRDYPNTLGLAKTAGALPQLAASLK